MYIPTLKGVDALGRCKDDKIKSKMRCSYYSIRKENFPQSWQEKLFKEGKDQWLAGRSINNSNDNANFRVRNLNSSEFDTKFVCIGGMYVFNNSSGACSLRVVTTLTLDSSAKVTKEGEGWKIVAR